MSQQRTRIGLCTDTHNWTPSEPYVAPASNLLLQPHTGDLQALLLETLAKSNLDLVLHLGDFACGGGDFDLGEAEFYQLEASIQRDFTSLPVSAYGVPGNHDCPPGGGDWRYFEQLWGLKPGLGCTIDTPQARLVLLHTQGHTPEQIDEAKPGDPIYGWVNEEELARLDTALSSAGSRPVLLFLHQLLVPWSGPHPWENFFGVSNATAVKEILTRHTNVRAVFQGHAHRYDVQTIAIDGRPCHFIVAPAIAEYPIAWLQLELTAQHLEITLQNLPAPDLLELSRRNGAGQEWRAGKPAWRQLTLNLHVT